MQNAPEHHVEVVKVIFERKANPEFSPSACVSEMEKNSGNHRNS